MATLNLERIGRPLATIEGGTLKSKLVCVADENERRKVNHKFKKIDLPVGSKFQIVPNTHKEREIIYICGPSGSGKSTFTSNYLTQYKKTYPQNPIYIFSALSEDDVLDKIPGIKRIKISKALLSDPLSADDFQDCCCIFDDIDVLGDKKVREEVLKIANQILEIGRHFRTTAIFTNHLATNGKDTRRILNESHELVFFPSSGSMKGINYLCKEYIGLDEKQIRMIKRMKTRWCCCFRNYPMVCMTERSIWLLNSMGDDNNNGADDSAESDNSD
jgi:energy-coupling factor transporter ATP-binding protein EcfA2